MWELDHKESWVPKNWCFWTVVLEKPPESPLDCKEIEPVNPRGNQSWIFIGMTDIEAETPILRPPDVKNWLIGKDSDVGKDWREEEKGMTEDEIVGWHHQLDGRKFEQALGIGEGQGNLACWSPWGCKVGHDWATELNWEYIMWNAWLLEQAGFKIARRNIKNLRYADDTTLMAKSEEELKSLLMKVEEESERAGLKFSVQETKIMAFSPIISWQIEGENVETVTDFIFLGPKIIAAMKLKDTCSLEEKLWQT